MFEGRPGGNRREKLARRRQVPLAAGKEAGGRVDRSLVASAFRRNVLLQLREHVEVLSLDHRPRVVLPEELAAVAPEARVERAVRLQRVERLDELLVALVIEPGVAAHALPLE